MTPSQLHQLVGVVYGYYTQYQVLGPISKIAFDHTGASKLDIYIDLDDILMHISNVIGNDLYLQSDVEMPILSSIVNMCGHYRNFYRSSFGVETTFFIIVNPSNCYAENTICAEYCHPIPNDNIKNFKIGLLDKLQNLVKYIPNVYMVRTSCDFNGTVAGMLYCNSHEYNTVTPHMVISKDPIVSILGNQGCWILRPKKYRGGDSSLIITPNQAFGYYYNLVTKHVLQEDISSSINNTLDACLSLTGALSRGLKGIKRYSSVLQGLLDCIHNQSIGFMNSNNLIDQDIVNLCKSVGVIDDGILVNRVIDRFRVLSPSYVGSMYMHIIGNELNKCMVDLYDKDLMFRLNETTFSEYPLDLNGL